MKMSNHSTRRGFQRSICWFKGNVKKNKIEFYISFYLPELDLVHRHIRCSEKSSMYTVDGFPYGLSNGDTIVVSILLLSLLYKHKQNENWKNVTNYYLMISNIKHSHTYTHTNTNTCKLCILQILLFFFSFLSARQESARVNALCINKNYPGE